MGVETPKQKLTLLNLSNPPSFSLMVWIHSWALA